MVYILGKVLEYGILGWGDGERIVMAHFVKDKVHDKQDIPRPTFQTKQDFLNQVRAGRGLKPVCKKMRKNSRVGGGAPRK
jgi:hypothetical protein